MIGTKLIDVIANLSTYDPELTIYASTPWTCESDALVLRESDAGGIPKEAEARSAVYFIEVFVAAQFLEGWQRIQGRRVAPRELCERLIQHAVTDA